MQFLGSQLLLCLLPSLSLAGALPRSLRSTGSLLDVSRQQDWDYDTQGQSWMTLGECSSTTGQSPVNVSTTTAALQSDGDKIYSDYSTYEKPVKLKNDGRVLHFELPNDDGSIGGFAMGQSYPNHITSRYSIYKIVIHTPSEHTFNGVQVPLELQMYHRKEGATLANGEPNVADMAIVAVGFDESRDEASPFLGSLIDGGVPSQKGAETIVNRKFPSALRFSDLYRPNFGAQDELAGFWEYAGSLTQPPCTSGVRWFVRNEVLNAKKKTLDMFEKATKQASHGIPHNSRVLQPMGARPVFPRFAENAVNKLVYKMSAPDAFNNAVSKAADQQQLLKDKLADSEAGSKAAVAAGKSPKEAVMRSTELQACIGELGSAISDLHTATVRQKTACKNADTAREAMNANDDSRLQAVKEYGRFKKECDDETARVGALTMQKKVEEARCNKIKQEQKEELTTLTPALA